MSVPGFPSVMCLYLSHGEKGADFNICLYLDFDSAMSFYLLQGEKGVV